MKKPRISIVTCSYNQGNYIEETILSIKNQSFQDFEHIVIDGGSTDQTIEILKRYPHVRWISEKDNGFNDAFAKGLAMAQGDIIGQMCTSDAFVDMRWFETAVQKFDDNPDISLVWGKVEVRNKFGQFLRTEMSHLKDFEKLSREKWFEYWLLTGENYCELTLLVKKHVFEVCYPIRHVDDFSGNELYDFFGFNFNFNSKGYLSLPVNRVVAFGRYHPNQRSDKWARDLRRLIGLNSKKVGELRREFRRGAKKIRFQTPLGAEVDRPFSAQKLSMLRSLKAKAILWVPILLKKGPRFIARNFKYKLRAVSDFFSQSS